MLTQPAPLLVGKAPALLLLPLAHLRQVCTRTTLHSAARSHTECYTHCYARCYIAAVLLLIYWCSRTLSTYSVANMVYMLVLALC
jgi:hypothetical protein